MTPYSLLLLVPSFNYTAEPSLAPEVTMIHSTSLIYKSYKEEYWEVLPNMLRRVYDTRMMHHRLQALGIDIDKFAHAMLIVFGSNDHWILFSTHARLSPSPFLMRW